jgi:hypothetical protein
MGCPILTDDIVALAERNGIIYVEPGFPQLRLWPESVRLLYETADALPRLTPTWDKRALDLSRSGFCFQEEALPLAAIYLLDSRADVREPFVEELFGRNTLLTLLANAYVGYLLDADMRRHEFESLANLARHVPIRRAVSPSDPALIPSLCSSIVADYRAL